MNAAEEQFPGHKDPEQPPAAEGVWPRGDFVEQRFGGRGRPPLDVQEVR